MPMNEVQRAAANANVVTPMSDKPCLCGVIQWQLHPDVVVLTHRDQPNPMGGIISVPAVLITCQTCGRIEFFNAVHTGVIT